MNISKLLKISALSCIGLFNVNNNIVNASNEMDIDNDIEMKNTSTSNVDKRDVDELSSAFDEIDINENKEVGRIKKIINNGKRIPIQFTEFNGFNNIVVSNGHITFYFNEEGECLVFADPKVPNRPSYSGAMNIPEVLFKMTKIFRESKTLQKLYNKLERHDYPSSYGNFVIYQANTDNNTGRIISLTEL